jgi:DNA ligase-1
MDKQNMLTCDWNITSDPVGFWMSEKLDGVFVRWNGKQLLSKNGITFNAPEWFTRYLPNEHLVGELWAGRGNFKKVLSVIKRNKPRDVDWASISFRAFDMPNVVGSFERRMLATCQTVLAISSMYEGDETLPSYVRKSAILSIVMQEKCVSQKHFKEKFDNIVFAGGEGVCLVTPLSPYIPGKSQIIFRHKALNTSEAVITKYNIGDEGKLSSLACYFVEMPDITFNVGSGLSFLDIKSPPSIGSIITVKYKCIEQGSVREPSFVCIRNYE